MKKNRNLDRDVFVLHVSFGKSMFKCCNYFDVVIAVTTIAIAVLNSNVAVINLSGAFI